MDHPHLLHGDPNMPIGAFTSGDGKVMLTTDGAGREVARELDDYRLGKRALIDPSFEDDDDVEDDDELTREFGSSAAESIRQHLYMQRRKLESRRDSHLEEVESQFRSIDRLTAAQGTTQDLALARRSRTESRDFYRLGSIPPLETGDDDNSDAANEGEIGKNRRYDAQSQFSKSSTVLFPYGKPRPSPTYHPDYPTGSGAGDNPNDDEEEDWVHELNKMIYEEQYTEMSLGELDENYHPVQVQKEDIDSYMKEKDRVVRPCL